MEKQEINAEQLNEVSGGNLRSQLYEGQTEGTLTSTKLGVTYHYSPEHHEEIGALIRTAGISEADKVKQMLDNGWVY